jgi:drug/metabolite transporter (DMT)-like permease
LDGTTAGLALLAALGFSLKAIFVKLAYPYGVDAITLLALRMGFSLPVFLWVGLAGQRAGGRLTRGDWGRLFLLGCLGYYGASILDFWGLEYISAGLERLILFTYPTLTILIGVLFQGKAFTRREGVAVALCYTGIGFAFMHDLGLGDARERAGSAVRWSSPPACRTPLPFGQRADDRPARRHALFGAGHAGFVGGDAAAFWPPTRSPPSSSRCRSMAGGWRWRCSPP